MKKILKSKLAIVSGWGSGLAILFCFFNKKLELYPETIEYLDIAMSASTLVFLICITNAVITGITLTKDARKKENQKPQKINPVFIIPCFGFLLLGLLFIEIVRDNFGDTKTAFIIGTELISIGICTLYFGISNLIRRK